MNKTHEDIPTDAHEHDFISRSTQTIPVLHHL